MTDNNTECVWNDASRIKPLPNIPCLVIAPNGPAVAIFHKLLGTSGDFGSLTINGNRKKICHLPGVSWWMYVPAWPSNHEQSQQPGGQPQEGET
jgi:hypothetical protein